MTESWCGALSATVTSTRTLFPLFRRVVDLCTFGVPSGYRTFIVISYSNIVILRNVVNQETYINLLTDFFRDQNLLNDSIFQDDNAQARASHVSRKRMVSEVYRGPPPSRDHQILIPSNMYGMRLAGV